VILTQTYIGRAGYLADCLEGPHELFVAIECMVGEFSLSALLDTGSQWRSLPSRIAAAIENAGPADGPMERMSTRFGSIDGRLMRLPLALVAEDGETLDAEATWFVSVAWPGPATIGWKGCLERLRFALDPTHEQFYFGGP
jgi:hypothetical protein